MGSSWWVSCKEEAIGGRQILRMDLLFFAGGDRMDAINLILGRQVVDSGRQGVILHFVHLLVMVKQSNGNVFPSLSRGRD